ncbi:EcsC family protein [Bacillus sp. T33-2]|uniref:EcsC family protein n=1 Tax=Bacillus sp. T33-2 TaxID=2054168 RepID=UPI000C756036|nr:EcsC family protein [Bacillus sp. T33-2]PLR98144.1 ABC transporter substrate-binding protein [Bacillus sp. T33-2]
MPLTEREKKVLNEIKEWEEKLYNYEPNDFELAYERYLDRSFSLLPEETRSQFFSVFDSWLFHLHALIQGSQLQMEAKERILSAGRVFDPDLETVQDLRKLTIEQLQYIADQQISRHRLYSFIQGGLSGSGGNLVLGTDLPAMTVINLRVVQMIAMTYGFEVNTPFEMMAALKVFHAATLPSRMQSHGWEELMRDLESAEDYYFYEGNDRLTDTSWLEQPIKQIFKGIAILLFRKRKLEGLPVISMAIGAGTNYQTTRRVTEFAHRYYQMRYFLDKGVVRP